MSLVHDRPLIEQMAVAYAAEIERLNNEIADLQSANKLLHGLVANRDAEIEKLRAALVELKCHLYAQEAMTNGEIIAVCRTIADRANEGK